MDTISWVRRDTVSSLFVEQCDALTYRQQAMAISSPSRRNAKDAIGTLLPLLKRMAHRTIRPI
jgi:hypothetical protein